MLSLQTTLTTPITDPSKKRKREDGDENLLLSKELKLWSLDDSDYTPPPPRWKTYISLDELKSWSPDDSPPDIEFHLEDTPLPPGWQRCLDITSGKITFYNTRTRIRTRIDPRQVENPSREIARLDLDLNLGTDYQKTMEFEEEEEEERKKMDSKEKEMMAGVCVRCHMLVMMRKLSPTCPNCKFLHSP